MFKIRLFRIWQGSLPNRTQISYEDGGFLAQTRHFTDVKHNFNSISGRILDAILKKAKKGVAVNRHVFVCL